MQKDEKDEQKNKINEITQKYEQLSLAIEKLENEDNNESTLGFDISKARYGDSEGLGQVPDELIKWAKVHFGIEK